jgi:hypothetical protein
LIITPRWSELPAPTTWTLFIFSGTLLYQWSFHEAEILSPAVFPSLVGSFTIW